MSQTFVKFAILIITTLVIAACSSDSPSEQETVATAVQPTSAASTTSTIELTETYTGENLLVNAALTVNYPAGWAIRGLGTQLILASQDPATIDEESDAIIINISPVEGEMLEGIDNLKPIDVLSQAMLDATGEVVEVEAIQLNDMEAATTTVSLEENPAIVYAIHFDDSVFIVLTAIKAQGFSDDEAALVHTIAGQIQYDAGSIPQSE